VRSVLIGCLVATIAGCTGGVTAPPPVTPGDLEVPATSTPFIHVSAGSVSALIPAGWVASPLDPTGDRRGFVASPHPEAFDGVAPRTGLAATWVDASSVGVPSDYYYLAASGPLMSDLLSSPACHVQRTDVMADHLPMFMDGSRHSPGDFVATGTGTCVRASGLRHRWSYFVAAPGFGPVRELGIPQSGLYVVAAVTRATQGARARLHRLLGHVRFDGTPIEAFVHAVRGRT